MGKFKPHDGEIARLVIERLPEFDCHCHILPGLDDGAKTLEDSLYLAGRLFTYGYKRVVCTSHSSFLYRNIPETVVPACERLQEELQKNGIPLSLTPSLEYRLIPETWPEHRRRGLLPWEGNHILIELPIRQREQMGEINPVEEIRSLVREGYQPVLAHPERYLWASQKDYEDLFEAGAAFQRNLGSVEGLYGDAPAERAKTILRWGLYTFLGTDTHDKRYTDFFDWLLGIPQGVDNEKED
ncbi:MAG: hypothetical protein IJ222_00360 [Bacteroidales bacterium]|nr:hypothetical protein [Bacteroidales bacterium]